MDRKVKARSQEADGSDDEKTKATKNADADVTFDDTEDQEIIKGMAYFHSISCLVLIFQETKRKQQRAKGHKVGPRK